MKGWTRELETRRDLWYKRINNQNQMYNHFENIRGIATKTGIVRSLKNFYYNHPPASKLLNF
jgi:hypothetical protein